MKNSKHGLSESGVVQLKPQEKTFVVVSGVVFVGPPTTYESGPRTVGEFGRALVEGVGHKVGRMLTEPIRRES